MRFIIFAETGNKIKEIGFINLSALNSLFIFLAIDLWTVVPEEACCEKFTKHILAIKAQTPNVRFNLISIFSLKYI